MSPGYSPRKIQYALALMVVTFSMHPQRAWSVLPIQQDPKPAVDRSNEEKTPASELTGDLLELLKQPEEKADTARGLGTSKPNQVIPPDLKPEDLGLRADDLEEQSENPLKAIHQSMLIAAGYLGTGVTDEQTQTLQDDILARLDDLIDQMNQSDSPENNSSSSSQSRSQADASAEPQPQEQPSQPKDGESSPSGGESGGEPQPDQEGDEKDAAQPSQDRPGQTGSGRNTRVQAATPSELQQGAWGQLPERVRKQMQSKMVEQFLPSYREQIEAYFQALLKTP